MKRFLIFGILLMSFAFAKAQQEFMFTHYMFNGLALNPAYAGVHKNITASVLHRSQWVGFPGAPTTQVASVHGALKGTGASLGGVFYRDAKGYSEELGSYISAAYRIHLNRTLQLSFGLQGNFQNFKQDYSSAASNRIFDQGEMNVNNFSEFKFNVGAGIMLHNDKLYIGFSVPQILNKELDINNVSTKDFAVLKRHYYLHAGYAIEITKDIVLKPNLLVKAVENAPTQIDLNANALIKRFLWLGVSYRSFDSLDGIVGIQITPQLLLSYATDFTLTEISNQSHEVMLSYTFNLPTSKILTPRYF